MEPASGSYPGVCAGQLEAVYHLECRQAGQKTLPLSVTREPSKGTCTFMMLKDYSYQTLRERERERERVSTFLNHSATTLQHNCWLNMSLKPCTHTTRSCHSVTLMRKRSSRVSTSTKKARYITQTQNVLYRRTCTNKTVICADHSKATYSHHSLLHSKATFHLVCKVGKNLKLCI